MTILPPAFSRILVILGASLIASACSPYIYESEITAFSNGVDRSLKAYNALLPQYEKWATEKRDASLLARFADTGERPSTSDACELLRSQYDSRFAGQGAPTVALLSQDELAKCQVTPVPGIDPAKGLPNLGALADSLRSYASALQAITNAEAEKDLEKAFGSFNTSATGLLKTVNQELVKRNEKQLDALGALVYQAGLAGLRQRRFNALKEAVNNNAAVVDRGSSLLAEAAFDIYGPALTAKKKALEQAENKALTATPGNYIAIWKSLHKARDSYIQALESSPVYAFAGIRSTHEALRQSLNNPGNRAQLAALHKNIVVLKVAAETAFNTLKPAEPGGS